MRLLTVLLLLSLSASSQLPSVKLLTSGTNTSIRGMSIPGDNSIWTSGSHGLVGRSTDDGHTWKWITIPGLEKRDFRDITAFDSITAIAIAVDNPAVIVKTTDGGATWKTVFMKEAAGMFLDAMDFKDSREGICIGDPVATFPGEVKRFYIIKTHDGGETWTEAPLLQRPVAHEGEALFAASGTNIFFLDNPVYNYAFVTGGVVCNLYLTGKNGQISVLPVPLVQGQPTTGIFSMATDKKTAFYCVGGNYTSPNDSTHNFSYTLSNGATWQSAATGPKGYRSSIALLQNQQLVACGTSGIDYTPTSAEAWLNISHEGFNVCMASGNRVFFAGDKGKIGVIEF